MIEEETHVIEELRPRSRSNRRLIVGRGMVGCRQVQERRKPSGVGMMHTCCLWLVLELVPDAPQAHSLPFFSSPIPYLYRTRVSYLYHISILRIR